MKRQYFDHGTVEGRARFEVIRIYMDYLASMTELWSSTWSWERWRAAADALDHQRSLNALIWAITARERRFFFVDPDAPTKRSHVNMEAAE